MVTLLDHWIIILFCMENAFVFYLKSMGSRYFIYAGIAFLLFYFLFPKKLSFRKLQTSFPKGKDYLREVSHSILSLLIFATISLILHSKYVRPYTRIYDHLTDHSTAYFFFSVAMALIIHDSYFYWTHRLMHHPKLFKLFHLTHHKSTNPSPWAAYSFSPLEAIVEGSVIFPIAFLIPIHILGIGLFLVIMIIYNVYGHLGYEIYPKWFVKSRLGKWLNTSTNHNMHHQFFKGNYGLYFRFWDELMGTTHTNYEQRIEEITSASRKTRSDYEIL